MISNIKKDIKRLSRKEILSKRKILKIKPTKNKFKVFNKKIKSERKQSSNLRNF
jgi:hypothetical protein